MAITDPTVEYGIFLKITPDASGDNPWSAYSVLYSSSSSGGTYLEIARSQGAAAWQFKHVMPLSNARVYYKVRTEKEGYTTSSYIGPVDALPIQLDPGALD